MTPSVGQTERLSLLQPQSSAESAEHAVDPLSDLPADTACPCATDNALVPRTADELQKMVERAERDLKALTANLDSLK